MSNYPKIYSLSTVGIRQHNNYDYLIHDVRTDFTGKNGTGKSIIADLMQLIFIPYSDLWKSGTEGLNKQDRKVWGMPLPKKYINFSYAVLNVERSKGKFITIGVYIPKNKQPVRPFIIQKSSDFENKNLLSFDFPLKASDFLAPSNAVLSLNDLKQKLLLNDLHFQDFYQKENIDKYFDILYKAQLCPIDLTRESNLKAYAKVLQSFSRANSLNINNTKSLQNFLFEDDEEIKQTFNEQKEQLESLIKQYRRDSDLINDLDTKQKRLLELQKINETYVEKRNDYYSSDAINSFKEYSDANKAYKLNQDTLLKSQINRSKLIKQEISSKSKLLSFQISIREICQALRNKYEELKPNYSDEVLNKKSLEAEELSYKIKTIEKIRGVYERYNSSIAEILNKFEEQENIKVNLGKIKKLKSISNFNYFETSEWANNYEIAKKEYQLKLNNLTVEIKDLRELLELYESDNPNSLFQWAIQQKQPLSLAQETILMHFKNVIISRIKDSKEKRYIENPLELLNSFSEVNAGIWIHLGALHEFVPWITKQKFNDEKKLKLALENDKIEIKNQLSKLEEKHKEITDLDKEISNLGYSPDYCDIWNQRSIIEGYNVDEEVNLLLINQIKEVGELITSFAKMNIDHLKLKEEITAITAKKTEINLKVKQLGVDIDKSNQLITELQKEIIIPVDEIRVHQLDSVDNLEELKDQSIANYEDEKSKNDSNIKNIGILNGTLTSCSAQEPLLKKDLDQKEKVFSDKKGALERETNLTFDSLLLTGEISETKIQNLKLEYDNFKETYRHEYSNVVESFPETKNNKNPELRANDYHFDTLVRILCGRFKLEDLTPELMRLNEELANFGKLQLEIIFNVFSKVEKSYSKLKTLVVYLNNFFKSNKISNDYIFRVDFLDKNDISIDWIDKMRKSAKVQAYGKDLFSDLEENETLSPEQLIINIAHKFSKVKNCELSDLLNPKYYFELKVGMYDENNDSNSGSGGQAYTALALLCIGRLSVIQKETRPGIKFIIIEELSNIDDTNFNTFPEIARQFGYQLLTMTPKPFGSYTNDDWFLHMLSKGHDKDINYLPMSFFKTKNSKEYLTEYMKRHELEIFSSST